MYQLMLAITVIRLNLNSPLSKILDPPLISSLFITFRYVHTGCLNRSTALTTGMYCALCSGVYSPVTTWQLDQQRVMVIYGGCWVHVHIYCQGCMCVYVHVGTIFVNLCQWRRSYTQMEPCPLQNVYLSMSLLLWHLIRSRRMEQLGNNKGW